MFFGCVSLGDQYIVNLWKKSPSLTKSPYKEILTDTTTGGSTTGKPCFSA